MPVTEELIQYGFSLHQAGKLEEAENAYQEAFKQDKKNAEIYNLMSVLKLQQQDVISAINWAEKAVELNPCAYFYETLFQAYIRAGIFKQILQRKNDVMKKFPNNFSLLYNLALAHKNVKQNSEAINLYERALEIDPTSYNAWFNLAHLYSIEGQTKNALSALKVCKKILPNDNETNYFLGLAYMRLKEYNKGLKLFESRISKETAFAIHNKTYPNKVRLDNFWHGENIKNKTIFVYYEAGFGDVIMFARYLPILAQKCKKVILYCQKPLSPLFKLNSLGIDQIIDNYVPESELEFDVHAPLLSLPYLLKLNGNDVFAYRQGYIVPDEGLANTFKKKYFNNEKIKVGIKWQGNTYYDMDRVIPTEYFYPLTKVENTQYYSFQTFEGSEDATKLISDYNVIDLSPELTDFSKTAAALSNLDLVICNDTSLAHLAGAMRIPCWTLLPYEVNWRWHTDLSHCDWYESLKLFRQHHIGDWKSVFEDVLEEMKPE